MLKKSTLLFYMLICTFLFAQNPVNAASVMPPQDLSELRQFIQQERDHLKNLDRTRNERNITNQDSQSQRQVAPTRTQPNPIVTHPEIRTNPRLYQFNNRSNPVVMPPVIRTSTRSVNSETVPVQQETQASAQAAGQQTQVQETSSQNNFSFIGLKAALGYDLCYGLQSGDNPCIDFQIGAVYANFFKVSSTIKIGVITDYIFERRQQLNHKPGFNYFTFDILLGLQSFDLVFGIGTSHSVSWDNEASLPKGMSQYELGFIFTLGYIISKNPKIMVCVENRFSIDGRYTGFLSLAIGF